MDKKQLKKDFNLAGDTRDHEVLKRLAGHESEEVRWAVAANSDTPVDVLNSLVEDEDESVKRMAMDRLGLNQKSIPSKIKKPTMFMSSLAQNQSFEVEKVFGLVFGTHSTIAWGFDKQSDRLEISTNHALVMLEEQAKALGANAVIGLNIALNSSQGAGLGQNSEGVVAFGTAVILREHN